MTSSRIKLLLVASILLLISLTNMCSGHSSSSQSLLGPSSDSYAYQQIRITPDDQWWSPFYFGNIGTFAFTSFYYTSFVTTRIIFTDCYCAGDDFQIYVNDELYSGAYAFPVSYERDCYNLLVDPDACFTSPFFSSLPYDNAPDLVAGFYNITIFVVSSPYSFGKGFLQVVEVGGK